MARARSEKRNEAKKIWLKSKKNKKLKDIASELGVSEEQIRKWKSIDKWDSVTLPKDKSNVTDSVGKNKEPTTKKVGAPIGSKNALGNKGGSAPIGNKNSFKHGEYEKILFNTLNDVERSLIGSIGNDYIKQLEQEVALLTVREHRILNRIEEAKENKLAIREVTTTKSKGKNGNVYNEQITSNAVSNLEIIDRLEEALTRVQERKIRAIETINRVMIAWEQLNLDKGDLGGNENSIKDWLGAVKPSEEDIKALFVDAEIIEEGSVNND